MSINNKKPYSKPVLEQVKLVMEEAVLKGCKGHTGVGPASLTYCMDSRHGEIDRACRGHSKS